MEKNEKNNDHELPNWLDALQDSFTKVESLLQLLRSTDYSGDHGINEAGFKLALISGLQDYFHVRSEHQIREGYADLHLQYKYNEQINIIVELKYIRGGFLAEISDNYYALAKDSAKKRKTLSQLGEKIAKMEIAKLTEQKFYDAVVTNKGKTKKSDQAMKISEKIQQTIDNEVMPRIRDVRFQTKDESNNQEQWFGIAIVGVVNRILHSAVRSVSQKVVGENSLIKEPTDTQLGYSQRNLTDSPTTKKIKHQEKKLQQTQEKRNNVNVEFAENHLEPENTIPLWDCIPSLQKEYHLLEREPAAINHLKYLLLHLILKEKKHKIPLSAIPVEFKRYLGYKLPFADDLHLLAQRLEVVQTNLKEKVKADRCLFVVDQGFVWVDDDLVDEPPKQSIHDMLQDLHDLQSSLNDYVHEMSELISADIDNMSDQDGILLVLLSQACLKKNWSLPVSAIPYLFRQMFGCELANPHKISLIEKDINGANSELLSVLGYESDFFFVDGGYVFASDMVSALNSVIDANQVFFP